MPEQPSRPDRSTAREITRAETSKIGADLGDVFVFFGHPLTCNGGNPDASTHHDHEVRMLLHDETRTLICPECGREQKLP